MTAEGVIYSGSLYFNPRLLVGKQAVSLTLTVLLAFSVNQQQSKGEYLRTPQVLCKSTFPLFGVIAYLYMQGISGAIDFVENNARFILVGKF